MKKHAVIAIINYHGLILLGKKKSSSKKALAGKWHVPGGNVEEGEIDEEALIREMKEETSLDIIVNKYIGSSVTPTRKEARWYECFADTNLVQCGDDLEEIKWVTYHEVLNYCGQRAINNWSQEVIDYFI